MESDVHEQDKVEINDSSYGTESCDDGSKKPAAHRTTRVVERELKKHLTSLSIVASSSESSRHQYTRPADILKNVEDKLHRMGHAKGTELEFKEREVSILEWKTKFKETFRERELEVMMEKAPWKTSSNCES